MRGDLGGQLGVDDGHLVYRRGVECRDRGLLLGSKEVPQLEEGRRDDPEVRCELGEGQGDQRDGDEEGQTRQAESEDPVGEPKDRCNDTLWCRR